MPPSSPSAAPSPLPLRRWLGLGLIALGWLCLWDTPLLLPLRMLVVTFHELGHALTALATGGQVLAIHVGLDEGGSALTRGGWRLAILNGGYLGSLGIGLALLMGGKRLGRGITLLLGVGLIAAAIAWFRPILSLHFPYAILTGLAFLGAGLVLPGVLVRWIPQTIGVFSVMYALVDIQQDILLAPWRAVAGRSDATMLAEATGIPALLWGLGWLAVSTAALYATRRVW